MNPDAPRTPSEELEIRITALLMGELPPDEAAALLAQIAADPELTALHARLRHAVDLLREARTLPEHPAPATPMKLSKERREKLMARFQELKPMPPLKSVPSPRTILAPQQKKKRDWKWVVPMGIAASITFVAVGFLLPASLQSRRRAQATTTLKDLRMIDEAVDQFATGTNRSTDTNADEAALAKGWASAPGAIRTFDASSDAKTYSLYATQADQQKVADAATPSRGASALYLPKSAPEGQDGETRRFGRSLADSKPSSSKYQRVPGHPENTQFSSANPESEAMPAAPATSFGTTAPTAGTNWAFNGGGETDSRTKLAVRGRGVLTPFTQESLAAGDAKSSGAVANNLAAVDKLSDLSSAIPREKEVRAATGNLALGRSEVAAVNGTLMFDTDGTAAASDFAIVPPTSGPARAPQPTNAPAPVAALGDAAKDMDVSEPFSTAGRVMLGKKLSTWGDNSEIAPAPKPEVKLGNIGTRSTVQDGRVAGATPPLPAPIATTAAPTPAPENPVSLTTATAGVEITGERDLQRQNDSWKSAVGGGGGAATESKTKVAAQKPGTDNFYNGSAIPYYRGGDGYEEVDEATASRIKSGIEQNQWFGQTTGAFVGDPQPVARSGAAAPQSGSEKAQPGQPSDAPITFANGMAYFATPTLEMARKSDPGAVEKDGEKKDADQRGLGTITVSRGTLAQIATANDAAPTPEKRETLARFRAIIPQEKTVTAKTGSEPVELSKSLADSAKNAPDVTLDDAITLAPDVAEFEGFVNRGTPLQKAGDGTLNITGVARGTEPQSDSNGKDAVRLQVEKGKKAYGLQPAAGGEQKLEENVSAGQFFTGTIVNGGGLSGLAVDGKPAGGTKPEDQLKKMDSKRASKTERVEELENLAEVQAQLAPAIPQAPKAKVAKAQEEIAESVRQNLEKTVAEMKAAPAPVSRQQQVEPAASLKFLQSLSSPESDRQPPKPAEPPPIPQPEVATAENAFSTFSLNVSDVSFKLAGVSLEKGAMPEPASVRSEEFINALDYRDPEPAAGAPLAFASERARYPFAHNRDLLRISVKTAAAGRQPGRPLNLVLLLDNSGSMERADRVRILKESLSVLSKQLQPQDKLSIITFSRTPRLWADGVTGDKAAEFTNRVGEITPQGGTDLGAAMDLGYQTALKHYQVGSVNRVVLLTDGAANLGNVNPETLKQKVESHRKQGVAFDCFGVGWEGYNDDLLEQLSRNGDGRYGFINTPEAAATEFAGQLAGALRVAASDVKVQVEFNPKRVTSYRQLGYAKHQLKKEQFRDNTVDAAEIGAAESGNALYTVEVNPRGQGDIATVRVRFKVPGTNDYREHEWAVPFNAPAPAIEQSGTSLRLAATSAAFSEWLAQSPFAGDVTTDRLLGMINGIPAIYGADPRPSRLEWMIRQAKSISGR